MLLDPYAIITASNVSIFIVLLISLLIILNTITETKRKSQTCIFNFLENAQLRLPIGFFLFLAGLLLRIGSRIPTPMILATDDYQLFSELNELVFPIVYTISEALIFTGFAIIFWPTFLRIVYNFFGEGLHDSFYIKGAITLAIIMKLGLTIFGLGVYSFLAF